MRNRCEFDVKSWWNRCSCEIDEFNKFAALRAVKMWNRCEIVVGWMWVRCEYCFWLKITTCAHNDEPTTMSQRSHTHLSIRDCKAPRFFFSFTRHRNRLPHTAYMVWSHSQTEIQNMVHVYIIYSLLYCAANSARETGVWFHTTTLRVAFLAGLLLAVLCIM